MLSTKKNVAVLGGSFNPVTNGHLEVAEHVLKSDLCDEVWLMPCHNHAFNKNLISGAHRLNMCELACLPYDKIKVSDFEIRKKLDGKTLNLLRDLRDAESHKGISFSFVIGLDNANVFDLWYGREKLKNSVRFIVVPRAGQREVSSDVWYRHPPHIFLDKPILQISSSEIREALRFYDRRLSLGRNTTKISAKLKEGLPETVLEYIVEQDLYKANG
jgi:nicotinate-nucleotide adenylyltransferase